MGRATVFDCRCLCHFPCHWGKFLLYVHLTCLIIISTTVSPIQSQSQSQSDGFGSLASDDENDDIESFIDLDDMYKSHAAGHDVAILSDDLYGLRRRVECRGVNITSLSVIMCDSFEECEEKKPCLLDLNKCHLKDNVIIGRDCRPPSAETLRIYEKFRENSTSFDSLPPEWMLPSPCYHTGMPDMGSGILQCSSTIFNSTNSDGTTNTSANTKGSRVSTFARFFSGHNSTDSKSGKIPDDRMKVRISIDSLNHDLNLEENRMGESVILYTNEEITVDCRVHSKFFREAGLNLTVFKKDGSALLIDEMMQPIMPWDQFLRAGLERFRVPKDTAAISCFGLKIDQNTKSTSWSEERVKVIVKDPPQSVQIRSAINGRSMTVELSHGSNVTLQCQLIGSDEHNKRIFTHIPKLNYLRSPESFFNSLEEFLRFRDMAQENFVCSKVGPNDPVENPAGNEEKHLNFLVRFAVSRPIIYKPKEQIVRLDVQDEVVVDQMINCNFKGEPRPYVKILKNGKELFYTVPRMSVPIGVGSRLRMFRTPASGPRNPVFGPALYERMEKITFPSLTSFVFSTTNSTDFDQNGNVNYSCLVQNHLGMDRLDFILSNFKTVIAATKTTFDTISLDKDKVNSGFSSSLDSWQNSETDSGSGKKSSSVPIIISIFVTVLFLVVAVAFIMWKNKQKCLHVWRRTIPSTSRIPIPRMQTPGQGQNESQAPSQIQPPSDQNYETLEEDVRHP